MKKEKRKINLGSFLISAIGLVLFASQLSFLNSKLYSKGATSQEIFLSLIPILFSISLIIGGIYLYINDFRENIRVLAWILIIIGITGLITVVNLFIGDVYNQSFNSIGLLISNNVAAGGAIGYVLGLYNAENRINAEDVKEKEEINELLHSLLTHDLRNKAQVFLGNLELLENKVSDEDKKILRNSIGAMKELLELIEKIRKHHEAHFNNQKVKSKELKNMIDSAIENHKLKNFDLSVEKEIENSIVIAGPLLEDILSELIENAKKHSSGEEINITLKEKDEEVEIAVADDGKGIPPEKRKDVFKRDYTETSASAGFGLYLAKKIIQSYRGSIEIKKSKLDGSRIEIKLKKIK